MKYSELEKLLTKAGCYHWKDKKRHPMWESPITGERFPLSYHGSEEVKNGTLQAILKKAGVK